MTLRNKDGSIYKLKGPNPIMKDQDVWEEFITHNMHWKEEVIKDENKTTIEEVLPPKDDFLEQLKQTKEIKPALAITPETKPQEIKQEIKPAVKKLDKTFIHCLPVSFKEVKDDLYGEIYKKMQYENPTSFEGVILQQEDLSLKLWTDYELLIGSIIYPKTKSKRWWKVQSKEIKSEGAIFIAAPSDFQPSFED